MSTKIDNLIENIFLDFIRKDVTVEFVNEIRKLFNIPEQGYEFDTYHKGFLFECIESGTYALYLPDIKLKYLNYKYNNIKGNSRLSLVNTFRGFVITTTKFNSYYLILNLIIYTFFDTYLKPKDLKIDTESFIFEIQNLNHILDEYNYGEKINYKDFYRELEHISESKPVMIIFNPNLSKIQIKKLIDKHWNVIKKYSRDDNDPRLRLRTKNNLNLNDFIYKSKDKKISEIRKELVKKGIHLDDGHISKIKNIEIKRRS
jgi:hypothetical protein